MIKIWPTILATIIYLISLIGCYDSFFVCLKKYPPQAMFYGFLAISGAGFLYTIQIYFFFFKKVNYKYILFELLLIYLLCFIYDTGTDLINHGGYNRLILLFSIVFWLIFIFFLIIIYKLCKNFPLLGIMIVISSMAITYLHIYNAFHGSCKGWKKGFKGTQINNINSGCVINRPSVCYYRILDGYFDLSKFFQATCAKDNNKYDRIRGLLKDKSSKIIGFPITTSYDVRTNAKFSVIQKNVISEVINIEDPQISYKLKEKVEVTVNYYDTPPNVEINIKKNQTLVDERQAIIDNKKNNPMTKNVLYLFIDSVSRANFRRKLPKFWSWIEEKYNQE